MMNVKRNHERSEKPMRKKRLAALLLAVTLLLSLAGCARGDGDGEQLSVTPSGATEPMKPTTPDVTKPSDPSKPTEPAKPTDLAKPTEPAKPTDPTMPTEPSNPTKPVTEPKPTEPKPTNPPAPTDPPHKHSYSATRTVAPTCTSGGYTVYACACGDSYNADATSALGHNFGGWVVTTEATPFAEGVQTRTCATCGAAETQPIAKLPMPQLDYAAAAAVGNSYGVSKYGWIYDPNMDWDDGYEFPNRYFLSEIMEGVPACEEGGQAYLEYRMKKEVDATHDALMRAEGSTEGCAFNCYCYLDESTNLIWFYVFYG